jgi:hypothetical protein
MQAAESMRDAGEQLVGAAECGDTVAIRCLLRSTENHSAEAVSDALHAAALEGHTAAALLLITYSRELSLLDEPDEFGWTALHYAVHSSAVDIVAALCGAGANVGAVTIDGSTPLHYARDADPKLDYSSVSDSERRGCACFRAPAIVQTLVAAGARVNATRHDGSTPLHDACAVCASSCALALIHAGADLWAINDRGMIPRDVAGERSQSRAEDRTRHLIRLGEHLREAMAKGYQARGRAAYDAPRTTKGREEAERCESVVECLTEERGRGAPPLFASAERELHGKQPRIPSPYMQTGSPGAALIKRQKSIDLSGFAQSLQIMCLDDPPPCAKYTSCQSEVA